MRWGGLTPRDQAPAQPRLDHHEHQGEGDEDGRGPTWKTPGGSTTSRIAPEAPPSSAATAKKRTMRLLAPDSSLRAPGITRTRSPAKVNKQYQGQWLANYQKPFAAVAGVAAALSEGQAVFAGGNGAPGVGEKPKVRATVPLTPNGRRPVRGRRALGWRLPLPGRHRGHETGRTPVRPPAPRRSRTTERGVRRWGGRAS